MEHPLRVAREHQHARDRVDHVDLVPARLRGLLQAGGRVESPVAAEERDAHGRVATIEPRRVPSSYMRWAWLGGICATFAACGTPPPTVAAIRLPSYAGDA